MTQDSIPSVQQLVCEPLITPAPWQAFRIEFNAFPLQEDSRELLYTFSILLIQAARQLHRLQPTLWMDTAELHRDGGARLFSSQARKWSPKMGFCFDPTGPSPRTLQLGDFMDREWGKPIKIYDRSAIHISNYQETEEAYRLLCGRGLALFLFFTVEASQLSQAVNRFQENSRSALEPLVASNSFKHHTFYLPLFSSASVAKASEDDLLSWMGNTEIYLRENFEDRELLLLAKQDLHPLFERIGMRQLSSSDGPVPWAISLEALKTNLPEQ